MLGDGTERQPLLLLLGTACLSRVSETGRQSPAEGLTGPHTLGRHASSACTDVVLRPALRIGTAYDRLGDAFASGHLWEQTEAA